MKRNRLLVGVVWSLTLSGLVHAQVDDGGRSGELPFECRELAQLIEIGRLDTRAFNECTQKSLAAGQRKTLLLFFIHTPRIEKAPGAISRLQLLSRVFVKKDSQQLFLEGYALMLEKKWDEAAEKFQRAAEQEPDHFEIQVRLAQAQLLRGKAAEALQLVSEARKLNPWEPEGLLWEGRALFLNGKPAEATEKIRQARGRIKESELASMWLAEAYAVAGQKQKAIAALESDVKEFPEHLQVLVQLARYRIQLFDKDLQMAWDARREIQLGMSRIGNYRRDDKKRTESELGVLLSDSEKIRGELQVLMDRVEGKILELRRNSAARGQES